MQREHTNTALQEKNSRTILTERQKEGIVFSLDPSRYNPVLTQKALPIMIDEAYQNGEIPQRVADTVLAPNFIISAFKLVSVSGTGILQLANYTDASKVPVLGMTLEPINPNTRGIVVSSGFIENPSWNLSARSDLFLGANGDFTTIVPLTNYLQRVGSVINSTKIFIAIGSLTKRT